jgi:hypothetical protein
MKTKFNLFASKAITPITFIVIFVFNILKFSSIVAQSSSYYPNNTPVYGSDNCGFGSTALNNTGSGPGCSAIGKSALLTNSNGEFNTACGTYALFSNDNGNANTALGFSALFDNCATGQGDNNTAAGYNALYHNNGGDCNTAGGATALFNNIDGSHNTAIGYNSLFTTGTSYVGNNNSALGTWALYENDDGDENTSIGYESLRYNTFGSYNTAAGYRALYLNNFGTTTSVDGNTAIGFESMFANQAGRYNVALGYHTLWNYDTDDYNVALGSQALGSNSTGFLNTAIGKNANISNSVGNSNTTIGADAMTNNTSGDDGNTAVGSISLLYTATEYNTVFGYAAFSSNYPYSTKCTGIGAYSDRNGNYTNATAIGAGAIVNASNKIWLGNTSVNVIESTMGFIQTSDGRFKFNQSEVDVKGLEFIMKLRPVTYNFDTKKFYEHINPKPVEIKKLNQKPQDFSKNTSILQSGFIAQEVEKAAIDCNYNFSGLRKPTNPQDNYGLGYSAFVIPLVKAIQEQQINIEKEESVLNSNKLNLISCMEKLDLYASPSPFSVHDYAIESNDITVSENIEKEKQFNIHIVTINDETELRITTIKGEEIMLKKLQNANAQTLSQIELGLSEGTYYFVLLQKNRIKACRLFTITNL